MKLLDSTFIIDLLNKDPEAVKKAEKEKCSKLFITDLSVYEIAVGINCLEKSKLTQSLDIFKDLIQNLNYIPLTQEASFKAAEVKANLIKKGRIIDDIDCLIAAIGIINKVNIIITRNIKHFSVIDKMKVETY